MDVIVFVRTRHDYHSYWDFWRLVELSGFETCWVDEIPHHLKDPTKTLILTPWNGEVQPLADRYGRDHKARVVWWNLERPDGPHAALSDRLDQALAFADEAWVSDKWYASLDARLKFVLMGSHPDLGSIVETPIRYDYCHLSYAWGRREAVHKQLRVAGLREAPPAYSKADKDRVINASRCVLSLHQYEGRMVAPLRFAVAAAYKKFVISETVEDSTPYGYDFAQADYEDLPDYVMWFLIDDPRDIEVAGGEHLHRLLCVENTFRSCVEAALA